MSKSSTFVHTLDLLAALKTRLEAIQLPNTFSAVTGYPKLFETVVIWAVQDLVKALQGSFTYDDRVCIIVPGGDTHDHARKGAVLSVHRDTEVHLLFADRNYGKENLALVGEAGETPGVLFIKDLVIDQLTGEKLGFQNIALSPTSGDPMTLSNKEQENASGRDCWAQSFTTNAGIMQVTHSR